MKMVHEVRYYEPYLPTPRHRKYRYRPTSEQIAVEIPEVVDQEAPIAIVQTSPFKKIWIDSNYGHRNRLEYRLYNNELYLLCRRGYFYCLSKNQRNRVAILKDMHYHKERHIFDNLEQGVKSLTDYCSDFLLVDGKIHAKIGEPRYCIMTFGLGHNHGIGWGTSLSIHNSYNRNITRHRYFRIDQEEIAREKGLEIALKRGDTNAVPHFKKRLYDRFEILIPDAVQCNPLEEHGDGDAFINRANEITESSGCAAVAGLSLMMEASSMFG